MSYAKHTEDILLVVDAQEKFSALDGKTIRAIHKEVKKALDNNHKIIYLEYADFGETVKQLTDLSRGKHDFVTKERMGGGTVVTCKITQEKLFPARINIVGVNEDMCCCQTAIELCSFFPATEIRVLRWACNTETVRFKPKKFWKYFLEHYKNLRVLD